MEKRTSPAEDEREADAGGDEAGQRSQHRRHVGQADQKQGRNQLIGILLYAVAIGSVGKSVQ